MPLKDAKYPTDSTKTQWQMTTSLWHCLSKQVLLSFLNEYHNVIGVVIAECRTIS